MERVRFAKRSASRDVADVVRKAPTCALGNEGGDDTAALLGEFVKADLQLGRVTGALDLRRPGLELASNREQHAACRVQNPDLGIVASLPVVLDEKHLERCKPRLKLRKRCSGESDSTC
jgi:hypothetical protein